MASNGFPGMIGARRGTLVHGPQTRSATFGFSPAGQASQKEEKIFMMEKAGMTVAENFATQSLARGGPVVIVDDDVSDALFADGIINDLQPQFPGQILTSGEDLVAYLQGENLYSDRSRYPYPILVLLDLEMPAMDGLEVLKWLRGHPEHAEVPVVVLSGCLGMARQVTEAYRLGALSFLPKPLQQSDVHSILSFLKISI
jgi:CheY-like chemotaxis protein